MIQFSTFSLPFTFSRAFFPPGSIPLPPPLPLPMVFILDVNSKIGARAVKIWGFSPKRHTLIHACATNSELPTTMSTMPSPDIGKKVDGRNEDVEDEEGDHLPLVLLLSQVHSEAHFAPTCYRVG